MPRFQELLNATRNPRMVNCKIFFKEGVAEKKIIKKPIGYSACDRFTTKITCNNPNSYSLELNGKRYKCDWQRNICRIFDDTKLFEDFGNFNISKVVFLEPYKQADWENALEKSLKSGVFNVVLYIQSYSF